MGQRGHVPPIFLRRDISVTCGRGSAFTDSSAKHSVLLVLWMTSCFHIMERMDQNQRRRMFRPVCQVAAPGAKSAVCDCILLLLQRNLTSAGQYEENVYLSFVHRFILFSDNINGCFLYFTQKIMCNGSFTKRLQLLGNFVLQNPYRGSAPGPRWGTFVPRPPVFFHAPQ